MTNETIKLTCPIFDIDGNETGSEVIEVTEIESVPDVYGDRFNRIQLIEISDIKSAHMDDVAAILDEYYGYFKYQIV